MAPLRSKDPYGWVQKLAAQIILLKMMMDNKKSKKLVFPLILLLVILVTSYDENMIVQAGAQLVCGKFFAEARCAFRCLKPGNCNECCKKLGFNHGKCSVLACYCCDK
ncbi:hypothetical protein EJB05_00800, partial [Eragrostis curvula]